MISVRSIVDKVMAVFSSKSPSVIEDAPPYDYMRNQEFVLIIESDVIRSSSRLRGDWYFVTEFSFVPTPATDEATIAALAARMDSYYCYSDHELINWKKEGF